MIEMSWADKKEMSNPVKCEDIMRDTIKKSVLVYVCLSIISCFIPVMSWAVVAVQTEVVSGNIAQKNNDHSIKLDNGKVYHSSRDGFVVDLAVGEPVTLRIVDKGEKKVFIEFAPGLNSLEKFVPAPSRSSDRPK